MEEGREKIAGKERRKNSSLTSHCCVGGRCLSLSVLDLVMLAWERNKEEPNMECQQKKLLMDLRTELIEDMVTAACVRNQRLQPLSTLTVFILRCIVCLVGAPELTKFVVFVSTWHVHSHSSECTKQKAEGCQDSSLGIFCPIKQLSQAKPSRGHRGQQGCLRVAAQRAPAGAKRAEV